jgi:uncharacterized protein YndB with AHSA1/START domain
MLALSNEETRHMIGPVLQHSLWIDASPERTWLAITETQHIKRWWGADGHAEITELSPGAAIRFGSGDRAIFANIRVVDPPHQFVYEWPPHPRYFSVPFVTGFRLEAEDKGTRLTFSESGFEAWPDDEERRARFDRISGDFRMVLENLKAYLEGRSVPSVPSGT